MEKQKLPQSNNNLLMKYAGLAMQLMVGLGIAIFAGIKIDQWQGFKTPLFVWVLPLLVIVAMIWQIVKDTTKR